MIDEQPAEETYEYLDSGGGRRLERFGAVVVDRPAPGATHRRGLPPEAWRRASLRFNQEKGWTGDAPENWALRLGAVRLRLRPARGGQVGAFPEHAFLCEKLEAAVRALFPNGGARALNLFAHTGLATLRLAALSQAAETVHVDAAQSAVNAARENATLSGLENARIRWITDDASGFASREARRGRRYEILVLDPPSFGRGGKTGKEWKFAEHIGGLLETAGALASERAVMLVSAHGEGWDAERLAATVRGRLPAASGIESGTSVLDSAAGGRSLALGVFVLAVLG